MKFKTKHRLLIIRDYCIGWTFAFFFLSIVRGVGTVELGSVKFEFWKNIVVALIMGPFFGAISGCAQVLTEERAYKRVSIQRLFWIKGIYTLLFLCILTLIFYSLVTFIFGIEIDLMTFVVEPGSGAIYFFIVVVEIFLLCLRQVNLFVGRNTFRRFLNGDFYTPKEEERVFMFLDLRSSTTIAERLGHIKYSLLLQDCFNDIGVVIENEAEIYQYVGDEVVLTWPLDKGISNANCLHAYFNFQQQLEAKQDYYLQKYDCKPFFKAGLHSGIVTVTEIGKYKKEIAYHGDTINTAARIQGKCNEFGQELLLSKVLKEHLTEDSFDFELLGSVPLKGKREAVDVFATSPKYGKHMPVKQH